MMKPKIWMSSPHMGGAEEQFVKDAFDTNWIAPLGPNVNGFEQDLELFLDHDCHVAALSSGTAGLHLGLVLLVCRNRYCRQDADDDNRNNDDQDDPYGAVRLF